MSGRIGFGIGMVLMAASVAAGGGSGEYATRVAAARTEFEVREVRVLESLPPQFEIVLEKRMPSAGWALEVENVQVDPEARRIVASLVEVPPKGMAAQVITPVKGQVHVGPLERGRWLLEIRTRREGKGEPRIAQAVVLRAFP